MFNNALAFNVCSIDVCAFLLLVKSRKKVRQQYQEIYSISVKGQCVRHRSK